MSVQPSAPARSPNGPLVSIVTAAYNAAAYLDETITSVLEQDYPYIDYVVLDDGSTDATPEVVARYGDRIRHERHDNMGETRTVNRGFDLIRGELVGVVSADDPLLPGIVTAMVERFADDPSVVVVYPDWEMIDGQGRVIQHITTFDYSYRDMVRWHHCIPGPGTFFRRSVVTSLGGRDPSFRYVADYDFWLHAGLLGPFARLPRTLARYRHHPGSASVGQLGRDGRPDAGHVVELVDAPERPLGVPVRHDPFGQHRPDTRQGVQLCRCRGVQVDATTGR